MSSKCFVPNCKNTVGVPFPKEAEAKKKWLDALKIKHVLPNLASFVCLEHFDEEDVLEDEGAAQVREGAVPGTKASGVSEDTTKDVADLCTSLHREYGVKHESQQDEAGEDVQGGECGDVNEDRSVDEDIEQETERNDDGIPDVVMFNLDTKTCRLCAQEKLNTRNIFGEKVENVPVSVAIMECIYPIEILRNDKLSKEICMTCLKTLTSYFKFRSICLENDKKQRDLYNEDEDCDESYKELPNIRKRKTTEVTTVDTKKRVRKLEVSDSDEDYDDDDVDSLSAFIIKKESALAIKTSALTDKPSQSDIDKKFEKVEQELRRVLEGQLTEEQAQAENIIIHVENDEEEPVATLSKLKLPFVIKPVDNQKLIKRNVLSVTPRISLIQGDMKIPLKGKGEALAQKGATKDEYKSDVGIFESYPISYVFGTEFCLIDEYLFEYRLCKGSERFLRCVLPACPALGVQNRIQGNAYSNHVSVQKPHNHKRPDEGEKKKQMFYYVMKRKMQSDKTLNFRSVYDEVCKHDPDIKVLVPLRNVINEICRHQLIYKIPTINSFDSFYEHIEDDGFQKLHFTHNARQFYQEKFVADDDSQAVVFANADIIEQVSFSKLMYVDASFKIDTNEDFKYQLVTVLVWIDESYYPILYALVNKKSQEIYKKIFEYLHETLAPKLRPDEIVTDYEANLYYALGETYLDSGIGGSVFYYTQNLYKKICTLNLSRDLETNSYFRNIYHMLLMLPLLPVNTILDGLNNMEIQARDLGLTELTRAIFDHVRTEWIMKVTPDLFCVHRLENRINENVIAPFKKLRDFIMLSKGKMQKQHTSIVTVVEKLIELEHFLQVTYSAPNKKSFARDLSSSQKKNVLKAWQYIESHPKININNFFSKVLGYIKCMENQLWIWGFYRYDGDVTDDLINATNFSIVSSDVEAVGHGEDGEQVEEEYVEQEEVGNEEGESGQVVMEAVIDENGGFVLQNNESEEQTTPFENAFLKYVYKE